MIAFSFVIRDEGFYLSLVPGFFGMEGAGCLQAFTRPLILNEERGEIHKRSILECQMKKQLSKKWKRY